MDEMTLSLSITGMTCAACVASVERVLSGVEGVTNVSVNLPLEKATVHLNNPVSFTEREACVAAVEGAGFGATELLPALEVRQRNVKKVAGQRRQVALAFALALPVFVLSMVLDDLGALGPLDLLSLIHISEPTRPY